MFRHIRSKLIAAFAVPLAILVAVAGLEAVSSLGQINSVNKQTALASASVGPGGAVQDLQIERYYAAVDAIGQGGNSVAANLQGTDPISANLTQTPVQVKASTDAAVASFRRTVSKDGGQAQADFAKALDNLAPALAKARSYWADAAAGKPVADYRKVETETYNAYTQIIDSLVNATASVPLQINDPTLRTGVEALYTSLQKSESQYKFLQDLFVAAWASSSSLPTAISQAEQDWGTDEALGGRLSDLDHGLYSGAINTLLASPVDQSFQLDVAELQAGSVPDVSLLLGVFTQPASVTASAQNDLTSESATNNQLGNAEIAAVVASRSTSLHNKAVTQALAFGGVGLIGILLGFGVVVLVSRSISRPLVDLSHQAERLATETLPATVQAILDAGVSGTEPPKVTRISVRSNDEVADMAKALDEVQQTAVELATGQAALRKSLADAFVNLGRRNQNLVTRQLEYISEIELKEADPESLEELFRLDHLATRMRRNAESLLILAGSGPARQWSAAVPAMDVARAASAEVEDYKRLRLHHFDQAQISGSVTTDLVHIMAELTENALTFSPPGSPVDIYGRFLEGGYVIVIVDSGIGMSVDDLEVANRRLEGEGSENDVPGRYLGHFVAGRLARRHGIAISLQASHSGGLVARVKIPAGLIEDPIPDLSAVAEVRGSQGAPSVPSAAVPSFEPAAFAQAPEGATGTSSVTVEALTADASAEALVADEVESSLTEPATESEHEELAGVEHEAFVTADDLSSLEESFAASGDDDHQEEESLPAWAGDVSDAAWQGEEDTVPAHEAVLTETEVDEAGVEDGAPLIPEGDLPVEVAAAPEAEVPLAEAPVTEQPEPPVLSPKAAKQPKAVQPPDGPAPVAVEAATPDLGAHAPLVVGAPAAPAQSPVTTWDAEVQAAAAVAGAGPAAQARTTADGLRKLTRRVPGASLPVEDDSLRRATPTTTGRNPVGLTGALSQYLSATTTEGRTEKEHNAR